MEMRNPLLPRERKEYRFAEKLRRLKSLRGLTQREVAQAAGIDESTVRNYELARRMPRAKQMEVLCEALGITSTALTQHYFGSPNQAMHYLFVIAGVANLTPENDENSGPRLRTRGNMVEWAFVCLTDKLEELKDKPATERHDELTHWLATFDCADDGVMRDARDTGRLGGNAPLPPKA